MRYFSEKNVGCDAIFDAIAIPDLNQMYEKKAMARAWLLHD